MSASDPKRTCSALVSLSTLRIFQRVAALIIRLLLLSQNSGQALLRNPKILTGVERSAEIVQSQICLAEQFIRLPALVSAMESFGLAVNASLMSSIAFW